MFTYQLLAGTTNVSVVIRIIDSTDGTPETGVTSATGGLDLQYRREGAAVVDLTESDLSALTDAHSDGGMLHIGNGYYRVDLPDAAVAASTTGVLVEGTATGMVVIGCYVQLLTVDLFDSVRAGLTALPNAAADAAGGLPISDLGGLDLDALDTQINAIETDTQDIQGRLPAALVGGRMDSDIGAKTGNVALSTQEKADVNTEVDSAFTTQMADSVATDGTIATREQALYQVLQFLTDRSVSGTTVTVRKVDGSTALYTLTLDDGTTPTDITRS